MSEYDDAVAGLETVKTPRFGPDGGLALPGMTPPPGQPTGQDQGYGQVFDLLDEAAKRSAKGAVAGAVDANPDQAARAIQLAPKVGVPAPAVEQDLPAYEAQHHLAQSAAIINQNPSLAAWLSADQQRARVAKDDFDKLDFVTKATKALASGWEGGFLQGERGRIGTRAMVGEAGAEQAAAIVTKRLRQSPELEGLYGKLKTLGGFAGGLVDNFMHGTPMGAVAGAGVGGAAGAAAGGVGALPGAAAGFLLGGIVVGPAADMGAVAAGNAFLDMSEMRGDDGSEISLPVREAAAVLIGMGTAALGTVGVKTVADAGQEAAAKLLSDAVKASVVKPTVQRALGQFATKLGKAGLTGAALNSAMVGVNIFGQEMAKTVSDGSFQTVFNDPLTRQQAVDQLITAAVDGAILFPMIHLPFHAGSLVGDTLRAQRAQADLTAFQQLETGAMESKTRTRSLDAFQDFMARQTDGTPVESLGLDSETIRTLYQSAGIEPGPGDGLLGDIVPDIREQMQQAAATGGDIVVPTAAYVARLAGTPLSETLRENIRFTPEGMTMREAVEYERVRGEILQQAAQDAGIASNTEFDAAAPVRQVFEDVMGKLREAGQTVDAARTYASLLASRYEARAERLAGAKGTAWDVYAAEGLEVRREVPETLRQADIQDMIIDALRNPDRRVPKDKELFGPSLHDAVRELGGVVDTGGELRAMDLHKTRGVVRKAKDDRKDDIEHGVDFIARRLWDMGYFPELTERPTPDEFFAAMRGGDKRYAEGVTNERKAGFEEAVRDLDEFISRSDIDLKTATNEEIKAALAKASEDVAGQTMQQGAIDTPAFKAWFGDSKVVDADGKPLVVYHGTNADFDAFQKPQENRMSMRAAVGFWFTSARDDAASYGKNLIQAYLAIQKPRRITRRALDDMAQTYPLPDLMKKLKAGGHDGLVIEAIKPDRAMDEPGMPEQYVAFSPEQIKSVNNRGTFDPADPRILNQPERGKITMRDGKNIITLMRDADLSTFVHETGHMWLEELGRDAIDAAAPEGLKADAGVIAKWLGADDLKNLTTEQHEQFARGIEQYLMEGKAPSSALASAFRKFKSWLVNIYKSVIALKVPMNNEIRGVFDRLIATDEAIASWRQAEGLNPVFATAKDAGMTEAEFATYTKRVQQSRDAADAKMLKRTMAAVRAMRTAEWKAEAATVREEVDAQQRSRADLKAWQFLRTGKLLDQPEAEAATDKVRISRGALEDMYGTEDAYKSLPSGTVAKEGVHPDELADLFGYRSGDDLVRALMSLEASRAQAEAATGKKLGGEKYLSYLTDAETTRRMMERHGDALNDGSIEAEALAAVHNAAQADVMALEMRAIARQAGVTPLTLADIRSWANEQIANMPIERATDQATFARAEAKAGRQVERALLVGKPEDAFRAKQQQLINHVMATKAGEAAEEYAAGLASWKRMAKAQKRETVQQSFMDQVHGILDRMGLDVRRDDLAAAVSAESLRDFTTRMAAEGQDMFVPEFLLDGFRVDNVKDMTASQFFEVNDAIKSIVHLGRQMREMEVEGERIRFSDIVTSMSETLGDRQGSAKAVGVTQAITKAERLRFDMMTGVAGLRRMDTWALQMDRGNREGPFTSYIVRPVYKALDAYRPARQAQLQKLWDIIGPRRKELNQGKIDAPEIGYTFANKGELLHAIAHTGNDSNYQKLLLGREWGEKAADGALDDTRWRSFVQRLADQGTLTAKDFDTVQQIWDLLDEMKPAAQEAHRSIYGVRFGEVTARPTWSPFGEYKGGYMPAITERLLAREGQIREDAAALNEQQTGAMFPSTGRGFTKARVENYAEPLQLNLAMLPSHIDSVLRFTHLQPVIRDVGRLMLKRSFKDMMAGVDPTFVKTAIIPWLHRTARQTSTIPATDAFGRLIDRGIGSLRRRAGLQILAFNLVNTMQQVVGVAPAVLRSSPGAMMRSLYTYMKGPGTMADNVAAMSPFMDDRMRSKSFDLIQSLQSALEDGGKLANARHWTNKNGYILQQMTQSVVDVTAWSAAYEHAIAAGKDQADAVYAADAAVRETQGGFNPEDISRFETGTVYERIFSHMYSYFGSQANLLGTEAAIIKDLGFRKNKGRAAMVYIFGLMIPSIVGEAIFKTARGGWGDDEDEGTMSALADTLLGSQVRYMTAMVPLAGPVISAAMDPSQGDRIGSSPGASVVKQASRSPGEIAGALTGEKSPGPAVRDSMTALGLITGLPLGQAGKPLGYLADVATGWQDPESAAQVGRGLVTGRQGTP